LATIGLGLQLGSLTGCPSTPGSVWVRPSFNNWCPIACLSVNIVIIVIGSFTGHCLGLSVWLGLGLGCLSGSGQSGHPSVTAGPSAWLSSGPSNWVWVICQSSAFVSPLGSSMVHCLSPISVQLSVWVSGSVFGYWSVCQFVGHSINNNWVQLSPQLGHGSGHWVRFNCQSTGSGFTGSGSGQSVWLSGSTVCHRLSVWVRLSVIRSASSGSLGQLTGSLGLVIRLGQPFNTGSGPSSSIHQYCPLGWLGFFFTVRQPGVFVHWVWVISRLAGSFVRQASSAFRPLRPAARSGSIGQWPSVSLGHWSITGSISSGLLGLGPSVGSIINCQ